MKSNKSDRKENTWQKQTQVKESIAKFLKEQQQQQRSVTSLLKSCAVGSDSRKGVNMKVFEIVAVYDNLTESFLEPKFIPTLAEAERIFEFQINDIPLWKANASDYDLYSLGQYNAEEGTFISVKHKICKGTSVLRKEKNTSDIQSAEQTSEA